MARPVKALIVAVIIIVILGGAGFLLLKDPKPAQNAGKDEALTLVDKEMTDVSRVEVTNSHGSYTVTYENGGYILHDLPAKHVNTEYLEMLLDECSRIEYLSIASEDMSKRADFGLETPEAEVSITYRDGERKVLLIGAKEPVSSGRYFMEKDGSKILLMKENRSIRFTMEVEKYIDYIIIPPEQTASALGELQDITFSGSSIPEPIVLKAVLPEREDLQTLGLSYGSVTHLLVSPGIYEANPTKLLEVAEDLLGLISEGVVAYNCQEEELAAYGFDDPYLQINFDYKNGKDAEVVPYVLKVSRLEEDYIVTVNDDGIVYKILDLSFLHVAYEDLILRWFVSPFISDVAEVTLTFGEESYAYSIFGETAKEITVSCNGDAVDDTLFRSFYNLVISAASDGAMLSEEPKLTGEPLAIIRYRYKEENKEDDILRLYPGELRRVYVEVNGECRFTMRENFLTILKKANEALLSGEAFGTDW